MPVQSKLAAWDGEGRSLQQLVSFCYNLWIENKSCLKKFFNDNEISAMFKSDSDLCEIARSAHYKSVESIGRFKILKGASKGASVTQKSLSEEIATTKKLKIEMLKSATDATTFIVENKKSCDNVFVTPCKASTRKVTMTQSLRDQIVKKLETEFTESTYTEDDIAEATAKFEKAQKVDMLQTSITGVNVLRDEIDALTILLNKSFKELIYCFKKRSVTPNIDWNLDLDDSEGILEGVAHSMFGSLCNLSATQKVATLSSLTASMKHSLKEYVWFLGIFKNDTDVLSSRKALESVLSCTLADLFKRESNLAHLTLLPANDVRVINGNISQFDFYVEAANLVSRPAAPAGGIDALKKVNFVKGFDGGTAEAKDDARKPDQDEIDKVILKDIVLALGKLEKDPEGVCMKEIRTELHSTEVKSLFERIAKGAEKKKKRAQRESSSDSSSDESVSSDSSKLAKGRPAAKKKVVVDEKEKKTAEKSKAVQRKRKKPIEVEDGQQSEILHAITKLGSTLSNSIARDRYAREGGEGRQNDRGAQGRDGRREGGYDRPYNRDNRRVEEPRREPYNARGRDGRDQYREGGGGRFARATGGPGAGGLFPPKIKKGEICDKMFETGKCLDNDCKEKHGRCDLRNDRNCNNERDGKCCDWLITSRGCTFRHNECAAFTKNARRA